MAEVVATAPVGNMTPLCYFCVTNQEHLWHNNGDLDPTHLADYQPGGKYARPLHFMEETQQQKEAKRNGTQPKV